MKYFIVKIDHFSNCVSERYWQKTRKMMFKALFGWRLFDALVPQEHSKMIKHNSLTWQHFEIFVKVGPLTLGFQQGDILNAMGRLR